MEYTVPMEFSRPECWSGEPLPSPGDLSNPGMDPRFPYVCVHTCVRVTELHMGTCGCECVYMNACVHTFVHACMCVHMCVHSACAWCMHTRVRARTGMLSHAPPASSAPRSLGALSPPGGPWVAALGPVAEGATPPRPLTQTPALRPWHGGWLTRRSRAGRPHR